MKFFVLLFLCLTSFGAHASGCDPSDVFLEEETILYQDSSYWNAYFDCRKSQTCYLVIVDTGDISDNGSYTTVRLQLLNERTIADDYLEINEFSINMYLQTFTSSCHSGYQREMMGVDYKGMRFRKEKDLDYL